MEINLANLEESVSKSNIIYFRSDHTTTPKCSGHLAEEFNFTWTCPSTWAELADALQIPDAFLAVHVDMMTQAPVANAREFMDALSTLSKFMPCSNSLRVSVVIKKSTPLDVIRQLQQTQCLGILLDVADYSHDEMGKALNALENNIPYWPKHILDELPISRPLSIYFRQDWLEYKKTIDAEQFQKMVGMELAHCDSWTNLTNALNRNPHQLIFHITELERMDISISEIVTMLQTKLKMAGVDIPLGIGILPTTTLAQIKELKRAGVHSIIPNAADWGIQETITAIHSLRDREPYWPKHIFDQLPGAKKKKANADNITLTFRQEQVFNHITERGSSNKAIAKSLGISESTVKLHLTEIFKKYGVRNRTQLAVFSNAS